MWSRADSGRAKVLHDHTDRLAEDVRGAELDDLRSRVVDGRVAGRHVVGISGLVSLLAVREPEGHLSPQHILPAGQLAAVVGQPAVEVREVALQPGAFRGLLARPACVHCANAIAGNPSIARRVSRRIVMLGLVEAQNRSFAEPAPRGERGEIVADAPLPIAGAVELEMPVERLWETFLDVPGCPRL